MFQEVRICANDMLRGSQSCRTACGRIISIGRIAEELLLPEVQVEVLPADSDAFTGPTGPSHPQVAPPSSLTERTQNEAETLSLGGQTREGEIETWRQLLEQESSFLELQGQYWKSLVWSYTGDISRLWTLQQLGVLNDFRGNFQEAKQQLEESVQIARSWKLLGCITCDGRISEGLLHLGQVNLRLGDFKLAKQQLEESLQIKSDVGRDRPLRLEILCTLSRLSVETGDFNQAKQYIKQCWQSWEEEQYGSTGLVEPAMLHALGFWRWKTGHLREAKKFLEKSLGHKRLQNNYETAYHPHTAEILRALSQVSRDAGNLKQAKRWLDESLQIEFSFHGDKDHPGTASTLCELGRLSLKAGNLQQAKQQLEESLRMQRSSRGDRNHPDTAAALRALGELSEKAGNHNQAIQYLEESLQMELSLYGDRHHPNTASTLHALGRLRKSQSSHSDCSVSCSCM